MAMAALIYFCPSELWVSLSAAHHIEHPVVQWQVGFPSRQEEVVAENSSLQTASTDALHSLHHRRQRLPHGPSGQSFQERVHTDRTSSLYTARSPHVNKAFASYIMRF